jgi:ABC-2 type transport system ATP-binding protein
MTPVVAVEDLHKSYGRTERLHGISFEVQAGEILGFLGVNGAGKTTTIEILEGYRTRDGGHVSVLGVDPARATREWRNRIGLVLQECELDPVYTVRETVSMFARFFAHPTDVTATVAAVGLTDKANDRVGRLSGGQKRRLDVAIGLVGNPEVLFLDEPTTGLDPVARREMWTMIEGLRDAGKTIFLTTHYMDEAQHLADRIIILRAGVIAAEGTAEELSTRLGYHTEVTFESPGAFEPARLAALLGVAGDLRGPARALSAPITCRATWRRCSSGPASRPSNSSTSRRFARAWTTSSYSWPAKPTRPRGARRERRLDGGRPDAVRVARFHARRQRPGLHRDLPGHLAAALQFDLQGHDALRRPACAGVGVLHRFPRQLPDHARELRLPAQPGHDRA